jgi:hypothetical protein
MNLNAKQYAGIALGLVALGLSVWAIVLIVVMIAHAISAFLTALALLVVATIVGSGAVALFSTASFERMWKIWN